MQKTFSDRKGQLTIYIVIAVVIVTTIVVFNMRRPQQIAPLPESAAEDALASAKATAKECLASSLSKTATMMGRGGRIRFQHPIQLYDGMVETMSIDGQPYLPSIEEMAIEMQDELDWTVAECIEQEWASRPERAPTRIGAVRTEVTFTASNIVAKASIPLQSSAMGSTFMTEGFIASDPIRFPLIHSTAQALVESAQETPGQIRAEDLLELPVNITIRTITPTSYLYELRDEKSLSDGEAYLYRFAVSFGGGDR